MCLGLFLPEHLFHLSHYKTYWTMSVDHVGLKPCLGGTSNFMVTLALFPWCKPKWSRDEFNNQSQILQGLGTTSWVHGVNNPLCACDFQSHALAIHRGPKFEIHNNHHPFLPLQWPLLLLGGDCTCGTTLLHTSWRYS